MIDGMAIDLVDTIGKRVKLAREHAALNQGDLAVRLKVDQSRISHIETGRRMAYADEVAQLARELDVSADYLLLLTPNAERINQADAVELPGICEEAEEAAQIIDGLASTAQRQFCVAVLRLFAGYRVSVGKEWAGELGDIMRRFGPEAADLIADYLREGKPLPDPARFGEILAERKRLKSPTPIY